jgi:hypothetical protein
MMLCMELLLGISVYSDCALVVCELIMADAFNVQLM